MALIEVDVEVKVAEDAAPSEAAPAREDQQETAESGHVEEQQQERAAGGGSIEDSPDVTVTSSVEDATDDAAASAPADRPRDLISQGSRVCVRKGRHFPLFGAGDEGTVIEVDREAMNCDVLFDGAERAVLVALRHLRSVARPTRAADEEDGDMNESITCLPSNFDEVAARSTTPDTTATASPGRRTRISTAEEKDGGDPSMIFDPAKAGEQAERLQRARDAARAGREAAADGKGGGGRTEFLEAQVLLLEERHRQEVASLAAQLEEARQHSRLQESHIASLEFMIRSLRHQPPPMPTALRTPQMLVLPLGTAPPPQATISPQKRAFSVSSPATAAEAPTPSTVKIQTRTPTPSTGGARPGVASFSVPAGAASPVMRRSYSLTLPPGAPSLLMPTPPPTTSAAVLRPPVPLSPSPFGVRVVGPAGEPIAADGCRCPPPSIACTPSAMAAASPMATVAGGSVETVQSEAACDSGWAITSPNLARWQFNAASMMPCA